MVGAGRAENISAMQNGHFFRPSRPASSKEWGEMARNNVVSLAQNHPAPSRPYQMLASSARSSRSRRAAPLRMLASSSRSLRSKAASRRRWRRVKRWARGKLLVTGRSQVRKSKVRIKMGISCRAIFLPQCWAIWQIALRKIVYRVTRKQPVCQVENGMFLSVKHVRIKGRMTLDTPPIPSLPHSLTCNSLRCPEGGHPPLSHAAHGNTPRRASE